MVVSLILEQRVAAGMMVCGPEAEVDSDLGRNLDISHFLADGVSPALWQLSLVVDSPTRGQQLA